MWNFRVLRPRGRAAKRALRILRRPQCGPRLRNSRPRQGAGILRRRSLLRLPGQWLLWGLSARRTSRICRGPRLRTGQNPRIFRPRPGKFPRGRISQVSSGTPPSGCGSLRDSPLSRQWDSYAFEPTRSGGQPLCRSPSAAERLPTSPDRRQLRRRKTLDRPARHARTNTIS